MCKIYNLESNVQKYNLESNITKCNTKPNLQKDDADSETEKCIVEEKSQNCVIEIETNNSKITLESTISHNSNCKSWEEALDLGINKNNHKSKLDIVEDIKEKDSLLQEHKIDSKVENPPYLDSGLKSSENLQPNIAIKFSENGLEETVIDIKNLSNENASEKKDVKDISFFESEMNKEKQIFLKKSNADENLQSNSDANSKTAPMHVSVSNNLEHNPMLCSSKNRSSSMECDSVTSTTADDVGSSTSKRIEVVHTADIEPKIEIIHHSPSYEAAVCDEPDTTTSFLRDEGIVTPTQRLQQDNPEDLSYGNLGRSQDDEVCGATSAESSTIIRPSTLFEEGDGRRNDMQISKGDGDIKTKAQVSQEAAPQDAQKSNRDDGELLSSPSTSSSADQTQQQQFGFSAFHPLDANATALTAQALLGFNDAITAATASLLKLQSSSSGETSTNIPSMKMPSESLSQSELMMKLIASNGSKAGVASDSLFAGNSLAAAAAAATLFQTQDIPSGSVSPSGSSKSSTSNVRNALHVSQQVGLAEAAAAAGFAGLSPGLLSDGQDYRHFISSELSSGTLWKSFIIT